MQDDTNGVGSVTPTTKATERAVFLTTCFVIIPGLSVAFVGLYGFAVWISQIIGGPPGAP